MPEEALDLPACVARAAGGDAEAARALVARCHPLVMRLVRAHRSRTLNEEDLAQEVYLKMFARLDRYEARDGVPFEHWLSRLAVRTCLDALRAERRRPLGRAVELSPAAAAWLEWLDARAERPVDDVLAGRELVDALLARLPPADSLVLSLLDLEERPAAEVARLLGWSATLVRVRAFRARRRLRLVARRLLDAAPREAAR
jgi:RNA polymerase sigma-70 factor (ECF subfamily)